MNLSLNEETYQKLKKDIMTFVFPPGEAISAQKIALKYNVSRTPAREAIVKLEKEGLLKIYPKAFTRVAKINMKRANEEWFVRLCLEIGMAKDFIMNCTNKDLEKMEEVVTQLENYEPEQSELSRVELDNGFHNMIYEVSGQILARDIIASQMTHYNRIRFLAELNENIGSMTNKEHRELIQAARDRDEKAYTEAIRKHVRRIILDQESVIKVYPEYFENE